jgi:UDP-2,3-diacylglucosamine hydrolase
VTTLFISDLHLEESRPDITDAFLRFLAERATGQERLYILGDFFEAWIGDDERTPLQEQVAAALKAVRASGTELFLMHGNRDFLIGEAFCDRAGAVLLDDPTVVDLYGEPTLQMILSRPLAERQTMARQLRDISMAKNQGKEAYIMDVTPEEVVREMEAHRVQRLIHGHTHRPAVHDLTANGQPAKRIVLGDWDKALWWLEVRPDAEPALRSQPLNG